LSKSDDGGMEGGGGLPVSCFRSLWYATQSSTLGLRGKRAARAQELHALLPSRSRQIGRSLDTITHSQFRRWQLHLILQLGAGTSSLEMRAVLSAGMPASGPSGIASSSNQMSVIL